MLNIDFSELFQTFWTFFFNVMNQFIQDMMYPINNLLESLFGSIEFNTHIQNFYLVLNTYVIPALSYVVHLIPPNAFNLIVFYYSFVLLFYSVVLIAHYIYVPLKFIKDYVPMG